MSTPPAATAPQLGRIHHSCPSSIQIQYVFLNMYIHSLNPAQLNSALGNSLTACLPGGLALGEEVCRMGVICVWFSIERNAEEETKR